MNHMDRQHRRHGYNEHGHVHELTFSCYRRFRFLSKERTCDWLASSIQKAREKWKFELWAYVFMPEHVHLVIRPEASIASVASILKSIKQPVGRQAIRHLAEKSPDWLPKLTRERNGRVERLFWQPGGGYDRNLIEPKTLAASMDYVHLNPVRRGLVEVPADFRWSSAGWYEDQPKNELHPDPIPPEWRD